jgi:xanthine dehydrogenase YagS FAD-binding subunit
MELRGETVAAVRLGLGGMAYKPWRAQEAEAMLTGKTLTTAGARSAAAAALQGARTSGHNAYKRELAQRAIVRALLEAKAMTVQSAELAS